MVKNVKVHAGQDSMQLLQKTNNKFQNSILSEGWDICLHIHDRNQHTVVKQLSSN